MTTARQGRRGRRLGLALAGGGPAGAVYEIGAVRALEEAIEGLDLSLSLGRQVNLHGARSVPQVPGGEHALVLLHLRGD